MKKHIFMIAIITVISLLALPELDARGGGGRGGGRGGSRGGSHGGGRGGGHGGGGRSVQRSPSMSRTTHSRPTKRPQTLPNRAPASRPQSKPNFPKKFPRGASTQPVRNLNHAAGGIQGDHQNLGNKIRHEIRTNKPNSKNWFRNDFWAGHHYYPPYYHHNNNWWKWTTAVGVAGWLGWNSAPVYYDYYDNDGTYYEGSSTGTEAFSDYAEQTQTIETATAQQMDDEWMPLGVFVISKEETSIAEPNLYLQLTLNKKGTLSGSFYNATIDQGYEIEGTVDKNTQTATMKVANDSNSPILETGVYNLTQSEAPIRVHFADGRIVNMLLVRLDEPTE